MSSRGLTEQHRDQAHGTEHSRMFDQHSARNYQDQASIFIEEDVQVANKEVRAELPEDVVEIIAPMLKEKP